MYGSSNTLTCSPPTIKRKRDCFMLIRLILSPPVPAAASLLRAAASPFCTNAGSELPPMRAASCLSLLTVFSLRFTDVDGYYGVVLNARGHLAFGFFQVRVHVGAADTVLEQLDLASLLNPVTEGSPVAEAVPVLDLGEDRGAVHLEGLVASVLQVAKQPVLAAGVLLPQ